MALLVEDNAFSAQQIPGIVKAAKVRPAEGRGNLSINLEHPVRVDHRIVGQSCSHGDGVAADERSQITVGRP